MVVESHGTVTFMSCCHPRAVLPCQVLVRFFISEATMQSDHSGWLICLAALPARAQLV